ncbi:hypothetical protein ACIPUP_14755 [Pectobacterium actinidiae]|uniref:ComEC/Rec2-related protein domain-containing protein n=1 Tax=Pectobacterium actinidiae TaxID=1507808 RepID=A0ABW8GCG5_9GAMM
MDIRRAFIAYLGLIPPGRPRIFFVILMMLLSFFLCLFCLYEIYTYPQRSGVVLVFFFFFLLGIVIVKGIAALCGRVKRKVINTIWRTVVRLRRYYHITLMTRFFFLLGIISSLLLVVSVFFSQPNVVHDILVGLSSIFLSLGASFDIFHRVKRLTKYLWAQWLGKCFLGGAATLSLLLSATIAKKWVYATTGLSATYFPEYVTMMSFSFLPLFYVFFLCLFIIVISIPEYVFLLVSMFIQPLAMILPPFYRLTTSLRRLVYRIRTGKTMPQDYKPNVFNVDSGIYIFRTLSPFMLVALILMAIGEIKSRSSQDSDYFMQTGLVALYYHYLPRCSKIEERALIFPLDGKKVSVATRDNQQWHFVIDECQ